MSKPANAPAPVRATLTQQKSDFTAEGSPPPGKVSVATPVVAPDGAAGSPAGKPRLQGTIRSKRASQARYP
jgi:acyl carrier protein